MPPKARCQPERTTMEQLLCACTTHTTKVLSGRYIPLTLTIRGLCLVVSRRLNLVVIGTLSPGGSATAAGPLVVSPEVQGSCLLGP